MLLSRADQGRRRSLSNRRELWAVLKRELAPNLRVTQPEGTQRLGLAAAAQLFVRAALLVGPHGGGFLNMIFCAPGTPVLEIGYTDTQARAHRLHGVHTRAPVRLALGPGASVNSGDSRGCCARHQTRRPVW